jgi:hypothetical protein
MTFPPFPHVSEQAAQAPHEYIAQHHVGVHVGACHETCLLGFIIFSYLQANIACLFGEHQHHFLEATDMMLKKVFD